MTKQHIAFSDDSGRLHYTKAQAEAENLRIFLGTLPVDFTGQRQTVATWLMDNREEIITRLIALRPENHNPLKAVA